MAQLRVVSAIFLLLLLLLVASTGDIGVKVAEARLCQSKSHKFHGACFSDTNCKTVCKDEGFSGGHCDGFRRRCFCTRHC